MHSKFKREPLVPGKLYRLRKQMWVRAQSTLFYTVLIDRNTLVLFVRMMTDEGLSWAWRAEFLHKDELYSLTDQNALDSFELVP